MSKVVITANESFASTGLSAADLKSLRDVNEKIAIARTDPTKIADHAWLCLASVASTGLSAADLKSLRDVNEKIAIARTDPTKFADHAWLCLASLTNGM